MPREFLHKTAAFLYALLVHVLALLVLLLGAGIEFEQREARQDCLTASSIDAETISADDVNAALEHMQQQAALEQNRERSLQRQAQALNQQRQQLETWQQQQAAQKQQLSEQQQQAQQNIEQVQQSLATQQAELDQQRAQANAQQQALAQRQAELALREAELQEAAQQHKATDARLQAQAEQKRQEQERLQRSLEQQQQQQAEQKRQAAKDAEQRRQAQAAERQRREEARIRAEAEAATRANIEAARAEAAAARAEKDQQQLQLIIAAIQNKTSRHWLQPPNMPHGLSCELDIRTVPSGEVVNVRVTQSSGNKLFDNAAEDAIWSASPLPVAQDSRLFEEHFRHFKFRFRPQ